MQGRTLYARSNITRTLIFNNAFSRKAGAGNRHTRIDSEAR